MTEVDERVEVLFGNDWEPGTVIEVLGDQILVQPDDHQRPVTQRRLDCQGLTWRILS